MEYYNQKAATKLCPRCKTDKIYSGHLSVYNAKSKDGTQVCTECKMEEILDLIGGKCA